MAPNKRSSHEPKPSRVAALLVWTASRSPPNQTQHHRTCASLYVPSHHHIDDDRTAAEEERARPAGTGAVAAARGGQRHRQRWVDSSDGQIDGVGRGKGRPLIGRLLNRSIPPDPDRQIRGPSPLSLSTPLRHAPYEEPRTEGGSSSCSSGSHWRWCLHQPFSSPSPLQ